MQRVLASKRFAKSHRLSRLLQFLVEHAVDGGPSIDEYSIASQVFGRPDTFVSQLDPVVRVQQRRLRSALREFYDVDTRPTPVMFDTPESGFGVIVQERGSIRAARPRRKPGRYVAAVLLVACVALWIRFRPHHTDPRAVQLDLRARGLRAKGTAGDVAQAARLFEQAVAIDSYYAPAWSGLADVLLVPGSAGNLTRSEAVARAREAAGKAIRLDPRIGEAHAVMAYLRVFEDADWAGAEPEFRRAIQLDPSAPGTHRMYAQGLMSRGRFDEAIAQSEIAAGLEPAGSQSSTDLAQILCVARRYDDAIGEARRLVERTSGAASARLTLGIALSAAGRYEEAIPELQTALLADHSLYSLARLGWAYGAKGDRVAANAVLDRLDRAFAEVLSINWSYKAMVYAGMGDFQHAVDCMESGLMNKEGDINFIGVDPAYDGMRNDLRFKALRKLLGVP